MLGENENMSPNHVKKVSKMRPNRPNTDDPRQSMWTRHAPKRGVQESGRTDQAGATTARGALVFVG